MSKKISIKNTKVEKEVIKMVDNKTQKFPSSSEIEEVRSALRSEIVLPKNHNRSPLQEFLLKIKKDIKDAVKSGSSIKKIIDGIEKVYGVKASPITISKFCKNNNIEIRRGRR